MYIPQIDSFSVLADYGGGEGEVREQVQHQRVVGGGGAPREEVPARHQLVAADVAVQDGVPAIKTN